MLTSILLELEKVTLQRRKTSFTKYQIKLLQKDLIVVRFVATDVYVNKKQTFFVLLLYVIRGKLELTEHCFIKGPCTT